MHATHWYKILKCNK